ncbi:MAG TPA: GNAT family N-acetyltransferase [Ktedonobacterales bacterium]|jgi:RimJ/RimL family protein N-acetyltransferase
MQVYLRTERLALRRFTQADVECLVDLDSDPEVMRYLNGGMPTPRAVVAQEILPRFLRSYQRRDGFGVWAAIEHTSSDFVGWFGFQPRGDTGAGEIELGYRLRRAVWGNGYATEGARALIHKGFEELGARRVFATAYQDNVASRRVMEKCGLRLASTFRLTPADLVAQAGTFIPGQDLWDGDDVEYELSRADWERQAAPGDERSQGDAGLC